MRSLLGRTAAGGSGLRKARFYEQSAKYIYDYFWAYIHKRVSINDCHASCTDYIYVVVSQSQTVPTNIILINIELP